MIAVRARASAQQLRLDGLRKWAVPVLRATLAHARIVLAKTAEDLVLLAGAGLLSAGLALHDLGAGLMLGGALLVAGVLLSVRPK